VGGLYLLDSTIQLLSYPLWLTVFCRHAARALSPP
jgi:hypothetical protein